MKEKIILCVIFLCTVSCAFGQVKCKNITSKKITGIVEYNKDVVTQSSTYAQYIKKENCDIECKNGLNDVIIYACDKKNSTIYAKSEYGNYKLEFCNKSDIKHYTELGKILNIYISDSKNDINLQEIVNNVTSDIVHYYSHYNDSIILKKKQREKQIEDSIKIVKEHKEYFKVTIYLLTTNFS